LKFFSTIPPLIPAPKENWVSGDEVYKFGDNYDQFS